MHKLLLSAITLAAAQLATPPLAMLAQADQPVPARVEMSPRSLALNVGDSTRAGSGDQMGRGHGGGNVVKHSRGNGVSARRRSRGSSGG